MAGGVLILGLGNSLLRDDGVGVHVAKALSAEGLETRDGGTLGLALLPEVQSASGLIVVDAARFGGRPGEVRVFEGAAMDAEVGKTKGTAHEVALSDLVGAARLAGGLPENRALVGVAPLSIEWGLEPTAPVAASLPEACAAVRALLQRWTS